jgi:cell division septum initiation protein DivIVA
LDVLELIDQLEDIIENSASIPMSGKVIVSKGDLLDILKDIRLKLPDSLKQAQWITQEKQKILIDAQRQADAIIKETDYRLKREIEHHDITAEANRRAAEIVNTAQRNAKDIRLGAKEYADQLLSDLERKLDENGSGLSEKLQIETRDMLSAIENDVIDLIKMVEQQTSDKLNELRENIKELRKINN